MRQLRKNLWVIFNMTIVALPHLGAAEIDNWKSASGEVWKAASGECWRNVSWTPDTAAMTCDGAVAPKIAIAKPVEEKPVAPSVAAVEPVAPVQPKIVAPVIAAPPPPPPPPPPVVAVVPVPMPAPAPVAAKAAPVVVPPAAPAAPAKITHTTESFFDFDKAVLTPESKVHLDELVTKLKKMNPEVVIAVGHTDSTGPEGYNQQLSVKRSDAVKSYLVSQGVERNRIYTEGKGESQPVADNLNKQNRAKNRRVEVEVIGKAKD